MLVLPYDDNEELAQDNLLQPIRNQLVASLPKMKGLEHLVLDNDNWMKMTKN
jgi:hypothetical protein